eukprot:TRINITY_DN9234_c0_g1_i4.p1 TRINITY_DN9234_c0_g1~~TRINITY_DN9234_c0_g1_i4.p1  ORF type:complete len:218 (+),score=42.90 TRINITY_DN9234_c0_g1_i4:1074-1727(+)
MSFAAATGKPIVKSRVAPCPPRQASPVHKSQPPVMTKPKRGESDYDILPAHSPTNNPIIASNSNSATVTKPKQNPFLTQTKKSEPINSTPRIVTQNFPSTGKAVKVGKHTIPAPPPNLPPSFSNGPAPSFSNGAAPRSTSNRGATLPPNAKGSLMSSIQDFKPGQLRPLTPDRSSSPIPEQSKDNIMAILRQRMEMRNKDIQQSDESASDFEDADDW